MKLGITVEKLLDIVGGQSKVDPSFVINNVASLRSARPEDLSIVFDPEENSVFDDLSINEVKHSRAGIILSSKELVKEKDFVVVEDPLFALQKIVDFVKKPFRRGIHQSAVLHETVILEDEIQVGANAVIGEKTRIGKKTVIGAQVTIGSNVRIGDNVLIHPGVKVLDDSIIGNNTILHSGVVIGSDGFGYRVSRYGMKKIPHIGIVRIGNDVEIGANSCIDRGTFDETVIGDGVKIDNLVHIAHNVKVKASTAIIAQTAIAGSVNIGAGCMIGGQVGIKQGVTIGDGAKIVSRSAIVKNVKDGEVLAGAPAMPFPRWKRVMLAHARLPEMLKMGNDIKAKLDEKKSVWKMIFGK